MAVILLLQRHCSCKPITRTLPLQLVTTCIVIEMKKVIICRDDLLHIKHTSWLGAKVIVIANTVIYL
jgi:hypothetical protein